MNLTDVEQSIIEKIRKVKYGQVIVKIEKHVVVDVVESHNYKPFDLKFDTQTEKL